MAKDKKKSTDNLIIKKAEKLLVSLVEGLGGRQMPLISEMTPTEYQAMLFGIYLSGYDPKMSVELVRAQLIRELKANS